MDSLISFGSAVKALGISDDGSTGRIGGYLVRFGSPDETDLEGDYFTPNTYFGAHDGDGADTYIHHGEPFKDSSGKPVKGLEWTQDKMLAPLKTRRDDVGIFAETVCNLADRYEKAVYQLTEAGKFKFSSGTSPHAVRYRGSKKSGEIARWPILEGSVTPTPMEWRDTGVMALKSLLDMDGLLDLTLSEADDEMGAVKADTKPQGEYGKVKYADPGYQSDKQPRYPIDTEEHVRAAWSYINQEKNAAKYSPEDLKKVKTAIVSAAKKFGIEISDEEKGETKPDNEKTESKKSIGDLLPILTDFYPESTQDMSHALKAIARVQQPLEWQADGARVLLECLLTRIEDKDALAVKSGRVISAPNWDKLDALCKQLGDVHSAMREHLDAHKPGSYIPAAPMGGNPLMTMTQGGKALSDEDWQRFLREREDCLMQLRADAMRLDALAAV